MYHLKYWKTIAYAFAFHTKILQVKNDLLRQKLGQKLYEGNIVQRKNENEVITHDNLITVVKEWSDEEN